MKTLKLITLFIISLLVFSCSKKKDDPQPTVQNRIEEPTPVTSDTTNLLKFLNGKLWIPIEANSNIIPLIDSFYTHNIISKYNLIVFDFRDTFKRINTINQITVINRVMESYHPNTLCITCTSPSEDYYRVLNKNPLILAVDPNNLKWHSITINKIDSTTILLKWYGNNEIPTTYKCTSKKILRFSN